MAADNENGTLDGQLAVPENTFDPNQLADSTTLAAVEPKSARLRRHSKMRRRTRDTIGHKDLPLDGTEIRPSPPLSLKHGAGKEGNVERLKTRGKMTLFSPTLSEIDANIARALKEQKMKAKETKVPAEIGEATHKKEKVKEKKQEKEEKKDKEKESKAKKAKSKPSKGGSEPGSRPPSPGRKDKKKRSSEEKAKAEDKSKRKRGSKKESTKSITLDVDEIVNDIFGKKEDRPPERRISMGLELLSIADEFVELGKEIFEERERKKSTFQATVYETESSDERRPPPRSKKSPAKTEVSDLEEEELARKKRKGRHKSMKESTVSDYEEEEQPDLVGKKRKALKPRKERKVSDHEEEEHPDLVGKKRKSRTARKEPKVSDYEEEEQPDLVGKKRKSRTARKEPKVSDYEEEQPDLVEKKRRAPMARKERKVSYEEEADLGTETPKAPIEYREVKGLDLLSIADEFVELGKEIEEAEIEARRKSRQPSRRSDALAPIEEQPTTPVEGSATEKLKLSFDVNEITDGLIGFARRMVAKRKKKSRASTDAELEQEQEEDKENMLDELRRQLLLARSSMISEKSSALGLEELDLEAEAELLLTNLRAKLEHIRSSKSSRKASVDIEEMSSEQDTTSTTESSSSQLSSTTSATTTDATILSMSEVMALTDDIDLEILNGVDPAHYVRDDPCITSGVERYITEYFPEVQAEDPEFTNRIKEVMEDKDFTNEEAISEITTLCKSTNLYATSNLLAMLTLIGKTVDPSTVGHVILDMAQREPDVKKTTTLADSLYRSRLVAELAPATYRSEDKAKDRESQRMAKKDKMTTKEIDTWVDQNTTLTMPIEGQVQPSTAQELLERYRLSKVEKTLRDTVDVWSEKIHDKLLTWSKSVKETIRRKPPPASRSRRQQMEMKKTTRRYSPRRSLVPLTPREIYKSGRPSFWGWDSVFDAPSKPLGEMLTEPDVAMKTLERMDKVEGRWQRRAHIDLLEKIGLPTSGQADKGLGQVDMTSLEGQKREVLPAIKQKMPPCRPSTPPSKGVEYLLDYQIPQLFQALCTSLILHQPDNPLDFLIDEVRVMMATVTVRRT